MDSRLPERLCFMLIGITASWLVFLVCYQMNVNPLYIGLVFVLPVAILISISIAVALLRRWRREHNTEISLQLLSREWDRMQDDESSE